MLDSRIMGRLLLGTLFFLLSWTIPCFACECGPAGHASSYVKEASVVFVGKVVFTNDDRSGKFTQATLVHLKIEEAFKGLAPEMQDVWVDPGSSTSCYAEYRVGERYLVFAYGGALLTSDNPAIAVSPGKSKPKPLPRGIDLNNPPKIYSAPACSGTR